MEKPRLAELILNQSDTNYAMSRVRDYYENFDRIDGYFRDRKKERLEGVTPSLFPVENEFFNDFTMNPMDMNFAVTETSKEVYDNLFCQVSSFPADDNPGKNVRFLIKETNTNTIAGFVRLGSPTINSAPRNKMLGNLPDLTALNRNFIMGFHIVPVQPFGFNYLGGKLLTMICCSHFTRRYLNKKYGVEICAFETTSLYGNIKGCSQYDGMKPYLRNVGLTDSKFLLTMADKWYAELNEWFINRNGGEHLIKKDASSRKLKTQTKMIAIIKASLRSQGRTTDLADFNDFIKKAIDLNTQKLQYFSNYGFENVVDYVNGKTDALIKKPNYDNYELENAINWWKKKAQKRFDNLNADGRIRHEMEVWKSDNLDSIDIIR